MCSNISRVQNFFSYGRKRICFFVPYMFFFILLCSCPVYSSDLLEVYKIALENDAVFQKEIYRHSASPETYKQAFAEMLPVVSMDLFYQYSNHEIYDNEVSVYGDSTARYPSKGFDLVLTQPLFKYSSIVRLSQAKEEVRRADLELETAKQALVLRVTEAYLAALEAKDILQFSRSEEAAINMHYSLAKERYENGLAPVTDFHDAKARLAVITTKRIRAEHILSDALEGLAEITGSRIDTLKYILLPEIITDAYLKEPGSKNDNADSKDSITGEKKSTVTVGNNSFNSLGPRQGGKYEGDTIPLITPLPDSVEEWISSAKRQNIDVLIKEKTVLVARKEVERQDSDHLPTVALVGRMNRDIEGGSLYGGGSDVERWEGAVQLKVPIFNGFSTSSKVREARLLLKAAEEDLEKEIRAITREAKAAFFGIKSSIDNITALKQAMISNQITLEAKKEGFKSGMFPSLAVTDAERDLYQTKQEYAKSQYEYIIYSLRLKKAVGLLAQEDIVTVNSWLK
jgi:outer membrane protein